MPDNPSKFWEELKRRKVVRVITVYAAATFVILEVVSIIVEPLHLPEWTLTLVIVLLVIGFIVLTVLSWVYDITPEGIMKTKPSSLVREDSKHSTTRGWKISTYISVFVIIAFAVFYIISNIKQSSDISKLEKSIAVIPFENWSVGDENSHLGDAIANEINTQLAKIQDYMVISYTSSSKYKGSEKLSIPQIGRELGANIIIEGTVERQGKEVSIHVQVIQAENDFHIWANEFKGKWNDIFTIRANIAKEVASNLKTVLTPNELERIEKRPTENLDAYDFYLQGNDFYERSYKEQNWWIAINAYEKAIELDPNFALAYTMLAKSYLNMYWFYYDRGNDPLIKSKEAIDAAFRIEPDLAEAHIALGVYYYWGFLNYPEALKELNVAMGHMPNNPDCHYFIASVYRRMGEWQKSKDEFYKAFDLNPRSSRIASNTANTLYLLGEYSKSIQYSDLATSLNPEYARAYREKIELYLKWKGNTINARETLQEASKFIDLSSDQVMVEIIVMLELLDGQFQQALDFLNDTKFESFELQFYFYPKHLYYALIYDLMDDAEKANQYYNLSRLDLEERILENSEDSRLYSSLGISYAGLGLNEKAIQAGRRGVELLPVSKEAWKGVHRLGELARIYVMIGEYELALEKLDFLLSSPGILSAKLIQLDPIWKPLWDLPEFKQLIEKYSDD